MPRQVAADQLKPCPNCGKQAGEIKQSELPTRFPYRVQCGACGYMTEFVKLPGVAVKLWNDAKRKGKVKTNRR